MNQAIGAYSRRGFWQRSPLLWNPSQRPIHATPACRVPSKTGSRRNRKPSQRRSSIQENEKKPRPGRKINTKAPGSKLAQYTQRNKATQAKSESIPEQPKKAFLCLASEWTQPSTQTSEHPAVQKVLSNLLNR
jgi:hypothetical protein